MSRSIISRESIMLGSGNVYFLDAAAGNYPEINSIATKANLLSRMDNVRINIKRELVTTKQLVNGVIHDKNSEVKGIEHFITFDYYEVNAKSLSVMHGGSLVDVAVVLSSLTKSPKKIRIEVEFLLPVGDKKLWYIFPKCVAASDVDMAPTNTEGATQKGSFKALPATDESVNWYLTSTYSFHSYFA